jgi:hypothetical protein
MSRRTRPPSNRATVVQTLRIEVTVPPDVAAYLAALAGSTERIALRLDQLTELAVRDAAKEGHAPDPSGDGSSLGDTPH